ncbi:MAG: transcriptional repressor LexA [Firmicutes bacterium]|nr:transcriptional repressor LexA [Bacillota bacterium]
MEELALKKRHQEILEYLHEYTGEHGYPPSVREIAAHLGLKSPSTVHKYLNELEDLGYIKRDPAKPRAILLTTSPPQEEVHHSVHPVKHIPVLGNIAAGLPILAEEQLVDTLPFAEDLVGAGDHFILVVKGESMIEAGILPGDYVIVRRQEEAEDGDIVVALLDDEATVKRFFKEKTAVRLQPENSLMEPIYTRDVVILGKVTGLYRQLT